MLDAKTPSRRLVAAAACTAAALLLAACAKNPESIAPVSMGNAYAGIDCATAASNRTTAQTMLASLESQQRSAVAGDAVGVFLIGVPLSSLTGGDKAGLIATEKGKILALDSRLQACARG